MRKVSAILSAVVSVVLIATGVMVAWLEPLAKLLPNTEFATVASVATGTDLTTTDPYQAPKGTHEASTLPTFTTPAASSLDSTTDSSYTSSEYLFSYSFGADFYTEIYAASYKIFNQLLNMSSTMTSISTAVADNYKAQIAVLRSVEDAEKTLADVGTVLNGQYQLQAETLTALETVSAQVGELAGFTASLTGIHSALIVIVRLMGVMIASAGLTMLCKALWKFGDAFAKKTA